MVLCSRHQIAYDPTNKTLKPKAGMNKLVSTADKPTVDSEQLNRAFQALNNSGLFKDKDHYWLASNGLRSFMKNDYL